MTNLIRWGWLQYTWSQHVLLTGCNKVQELFKMQITKSLCKAMFAISQFISEVDVNIRNNKVSLFNKWTLSMSDLMLSALLEAAYVVVDKYSPG